MAITNTVSYTTSTGFSLDSSRIGFTNSTGVLIDQINDFASGTATFHADYASTIGGTWGDGTLAADATGTATLSGGQLHCTGAALGYVKYTATDNVAGVQAGAVRLTWIPNYTGDPGGFRSIIGMRATSGSDVNLFTLYHQAGEGIVWGMSDQSGTSIFSTNLGVFSVTAGQSYEVEANWNISTGVSQLFINGTQHGSTITATGTRDSVILEIHVGGDAKFNLVSDARFDDVVIFNSVQHTANYTSGVTIPSTQYNTSNPSFNYSTAFSADSLTAFSTTETATGSDGIKYIINLNATDYWYDASDASWETSDGTYSQANSVSAVNSNISTLMTDAGTSGGDVLLKVLLHSESGTSTPAITSHSFTYDYFASTPSALTECVITGFINDLLGDAVTDCRLGAKYSTHIISGSRIVLPSETNVTVDSEGRFEISLVETQTSSNSVTANMTFHYRQNGDNKKLLFKNVVIPNTITADFTSLSGVS